VATVLISRTCTAPATEGVLGCRSGGKGDCVILSEAAEQVLPAVPQAIPDGLEVIAPATVLIGTPNGEIAAPLMFGYSKYALAGIECECCGHTLC